MRFRHLSSACFCASHASVRNPSSLRFGPIAYHVMGVTFDIVHGLSSGVGEESTEAHARSYCGHPRIVTYFPFRAVRVPWNGQRPRGPGPGRWWLQVDPCCFKMPRSVASAGAKVKRRIRYQAAWKQNTLHQGQSIHSE